MCLAIPGRVSRIELDPGGGRTAQVDYPGLMKRVSLVYLPEAMPGDYVLVQAGFAIRRLTEEQAREVLADLGADPTPGPAGPATSAAGGDA